MKHVASSVYAQAFFVVILKGHYDILGTLMWLDRLYVGQKSKLNAACATFFTS